MNEEVKYNCRNQTILLTGVTGFLGSLVCEELLKHDLKIIGLTKSGNLSRLKKYSNSSNLEILTADINDKTQLEKIFSYEKIDIVVHLAAHLHKGVTLGNPFDCSFTNIIGTLNLLSLSKKFGVTNFMYGSTMGVYSDNPKNLPVNEHYDKNPKNIYGASKLAGELLSQSYSKEFDLTILRYAGLYGINQPSNFVIPTFLKRAKENKPIILDGGGLQSTDFIYISDAVFVTVGCILNQIIGTYNVGSGYEVKIVDLAREIIEQAESSSELITSNVNSERQFRFVMNIKNIQSKLPFRPIRVDEGISRLLNNINRGLE